MLIRIIEHIKKLTLSGDLSTPTQQVIQSNKITVPIQRIEQQHCTGAKNSSYRPDDLALRNAMWRSLRAALRGDKDAQFQMGISYLYGQLGLDRSYSHATRWLDQAAYQGHLEAQQVLQNAYEELAFS